MTIRQLLLATLCVSNITISLAPPPSADELASALSGDDDMDPMAALDEPTEQEPAFQEEEQDTEAASQEQDMSSEGVSGAASVEDAPENVVKPTPELAPTNAPAQVEEASDTPLFVPKNPESTVLSRKQMFEQTESAATKAREQMRAIDEIKSAKMNEYITLDGELDAHAKEVGLARGKAADSIGDIKDALWQQIEAAVSGADDASQKQIADHKSMVEELQTATGALSESEARVVAALKELSDAVSAALDSGASVAAKRRELKGVVDDPAAEKLFEEIKAIPDQLQTTKDELTAAEGVVTRLDAAMEDARAHATKVKDLVNALKALNLDVSKTIETFVSNIAPTAAEQEPATSPADDSQEVLAARESIAVDDAIPAEGKKKTRRRPSGLEKMVKGTGAEGVYYWLADAGAATWRMIKPISAKVRGWFSWGATKVGKTAQKHLPEIPEKAPNTEVTWGALAKKFFHKLYVSVGRGARRVYQWWNGTYDPLAIQKSEAGEKKEAQAVVADAPALQSAGEVIPKIVAEPVAEKSTAPVGSAAPKAPAVTPDAGPITPVVANEQEQQAAVAQEIAAAAAEVAVAKQEVEGAQNAVANILADAQVQTAATEKSVKKVRKDVAFVNLGG